jgi:hypothetical protein
VLRSLMGYQLKVTRCLPQEGVCRQDAYYLTDSLGRPTRSQDVAVCSVHRSLPPGHTGSVFPTVHTGTWTRIPGSSENESENVESLTVRL